MIEFTPELLVGIVGTVLSLIFSYFPVVHDWYQALKTEAKSGIMLGLLVISSLVVVALVYYGVFSRLRANHMAVVAACFVRRHCDEPSNISYQSTKERVGKWGGVIPPLTSY